MQRDMGIREKERLLKKKKERGGETIQCKRSKRVRSESRRDAEECE